MSDDFKDEIGFSKDEIATIISDIRDASDALKEGDASDIINTQACWNLTDNELCSTRHMSDEDLAMALVEDMLNVVSWRMEGKETGGNREHYVRFLKDEQRDRALAAFEHQYVKSLIVEHENGVVELSPEHMQDAMDFCGVWLDGWEPLTDETVYEANIP